MFSPVYRRAIAAKAVQATQARNAASLSQIKSRQLATQSIAKMTSAMKMVASSKLRGAQEAITTAAAMYQDLANCIDAPEKIEENEFGHKGDLFVVLASDRGLCGGFNNIIVREYRPIIQDAKKADGARIIVIGEKARAGLDRQFRSIFDQSFVETAKIKKMTFRQVSMCADAINDASFLTGHLVFTKFINSVSSAPTSVKFYPIDILMRNTELTSKFDNEGDDEVYKNLWEYMNATGLFFANAHSFASETASRMAAMTTSSQNAGEMGTKYKMQYNRTRQAKITAELSEIISGAAAAEDMV